MNRLDELDDRLISLFDHPGVWWTGLVVAVVVGCAHAVAPGHGKSIAAAYLLGSHGRYRDAFLLGAIVAGMHTFSVLVLALGWVGLTASGGPDTRLLTSWLQVLSAVIVIAVGAGLVRRYVRSVRSAPASAGAGHGPGHGLGHGRGHGHGLGHGHGHGHGHSPPPGVAPWSRRGLVALGLSGGLLPSPSAFLVLVSGILTGRTVYALILVVCFAAGLAGTLTAVGLLVIKGGSMLGESAGRRSSRLARLARSVPLAAAVGVTLGGLAYLFVGLSAVASAS